jgi:hypothetical protein
MTKIYTQSSIQALEIYLKEIQRGNEVRVSSKTNRIYKANWVDKLILKIDKKVFDGNQASLWRAEAKMAIVNKFSDECALVEPEMNVKENSLIRTSLLSEWNNLEFDKKTVDDIKNKFLQNANYYSKKHENIKKILENGINPNEYFFKEAIKKSKSFDFAVELSKKANSLKENLGLPKNYIFHLTYNAQLLQKKHNFSIGECVNIIQFSDQLVTKHRMNESDALSFAIDLKEPLNSMNLSFDDISSVARSIFHNGSFSEKTKISAALAYCQLKKLDKDHEQSMSIIKKRIDNLKHIALQLPKGCKAECIHQGAHIRGKFTLTPDEIASCESKLNSLKPDQALNQEKGLTEKFESMSAQFGKDIRRMNYQFLKNGKTAPEVRSLIPNDTKLNIGSTDQEKESWIGSFINYAGGENAANVLSAFISQTMFGDIRTVTASSNSKDLSVQFTGQLGTDNFNFLVDQTEVDKVRKTLVKATQFINPMKMSSTNLNENAYLPDAPTEFDLISAIGNDQRATPTGFGAKYECELEFDTEKLQQQIVDFAIKRIVAEFDLVLDQDNVDRYFEKVEIL